MNNNNEIKLFKQGDNQVLQVIETIPSQEEQITSLALCPDNSSFFVGTDSGSVYHWTKKDELFSLKDIDADAEVKPAPIDRTSEIRKRRIKRGLLAGCAIGATYLGAKALLSSK